jgi:hypothetical protein
MRSHRMLPIAMAFAAAAAMSNWPERTEAWAQSTYTSPSGDFSVAFPAVPQAAAHLPANGDDPGFRTYVAQSNGGSYQVRVDEYPKSIPPPPPSQKAYELMLRAYAVEGSGHLASVAPVQLGGRAGAEGVITYPSGDTERRRVVMVGRLIYQVSYTHAEAVGTSGDGSAFLESFSFAH